MVEFGVGTPAIILFGGYVIYTGQLAMGTYLLLTDMNYVPLIICAIKISRAGPPAAEITRDMSADRHYVRKYSAQQLIIFVPFAVLLLAGVQEINRRRGTRSPGHQGRDPRMWRTEG